MHPKASWVCWWTQLCTNKHTHHLAEVLTTFHSISLNLLQIILWHHKLLPHLTAFPFLLSCLDLSGIERPLVQMVFLLLLLRQEMENTCHGGFDQKILKFDTTNVVLFQFINCSFVWCVAAYFCVSLCACVSPSWCPWCPAASSPSTGQRSRRGRCRT